MTAHRSPVIGDLEPGDGGGDTLYGSLSSSPFVLFLLDQPPGAAKVGILAAAPTAIGTARAHAKLDLPPSRREAIGTIDSLAGPTD